MDSSQGEGVLDYSYFPEGVMLHHMYKGFVDTAGTEHREIGEDSDIPDSYSLAIENPGLPHPRFLDKIVQSFFEGECWKN